MKSKDEIANWTKPDDDGTIHIPDELDPLVNNVALQLRLHTIHGKNEIQTIANIVYFAEQFFREKHEQKHNDAIPEGYISPKMGLPNNGEEVMVITNIRREAVVRFELFLGNEMWETDGDSEPDETVIGWKRK